MSEIAPEAPQSPQPVYSDTPSSIMLRSRMVEGFRSVNLIPIQRQPASAPNFSAEYYGRDADGNMGPLEEES